MPIAAALTELSYLYRQKPETVQTWGAAGKDMPPTICWKIRKEGTAWEAEQATLGDEPACDMIAYLPTYKAERRTTLTYQYRLPTINGATTFYGAAFYPPNIHGGVTLGGLCLGWSFQAAACMPGQAGGGCLHACQWLRREEPCLWEEEPGQAWQWL